MLYCTFKFSKILKPAALVVAAALVLTVAGTAFSGVSQTFAPKRQKLPCVKAKTEEQRQELIKALGWETNELSPVEEEVIIPKDFDEIYVKYNNLQKEQGLDLKRHRGKKAAKFTYFIENYPNEAENVRLTLLVRNGKVIGGDVCSLGLNGFMHSVFFPNQNSLTA